MISTLAICTALAALGADNIRIQQRGGEWQECRAIIKQAQTGIGVMTCNGFMLAGECFLHFPGPR